MRELIKERENNSRRGRHMLQKEKKKERTVKVTPSVLEKKWTNYCSWRGIATRIELIKYFIFYEIRINASFLNAKGNVPFTSFFFGFFGSKRVLHLSLNSQTYQNQPVWPSILVAFGTDYKMPSPTCPFPMVWVWEWLCFYRLWNHWPSPPLHSLRTHQHHHHHHIDLLLFFQLSL